MTNRCIPRKVALWVLASAGCLGLSPTVLSQSNLSLATEFYYEASKLDYGDRERDIAALGNSSTFGFGYKAGPHSLINGYHWDVSKRITGGDDWSNRWNGSSRYFFIPSNRRIELNAGHSIRAVGPRDEYPIDTTSYDTYNTLTLGGDLNFQPTERSKLNFSTQATQVFDEDLDRDGRQLNVQSSLVVTPSRKVVTTLSASRDYQWGRDFANENTMDNVQLGHRRSKGGKELNMAIGVGKFSSDRGSRETITGNLSHRWAYSLRQTSIGYARSITNTLAELSIPTTEEELAEGEDLEAMDVVEIQSASIKDVLNISHQSQQLCKRCAVQFDASLATYEILYIDERNFESSAGITLDYQLAERTSSSFGYQWRGIYDKLDHPPTSELHRVHMQLQRQITRKAHLIALVEHSRRVGDAADRTMGKLSVRFDLIGRNDAASP